VTAVGEDQFEFFAVHVLTRLDSTDERLLLGREALAVAVGDPASVGAQRRDAGVRRDVEHRAARRVDHHVAAVVVADRHAERDGVEHGSQSGALGLDLGEQLGVVEADRRLRRQRLGQRHLVVRPRLALPGVDLDRADSAAAYDQRRGEHRDDRLAVLRLWHLQVRSKRHVFEVAGAALLAHEVRERLIGGDALLVDSLGTEAVVAADDEVVALADEDRRRGRRQDPLGPSL